jgi:uncharacterized membrane protein YedE/YeeE
VKYIKFLVLGILFGLVMAKAEIISWYRIYEMFNFDSFHMYGIIGSAVILGSIGVQVLKRQNIKSKYGEELHLSEKSMSIPRYLFGGIIFGLGWALVGACPGPMFVLIGYGYLPILVVLLGALLGTFIYGIVRNRLPH